MFTTVSYTHLDVYKRQVETMFSSLDTQLKQFKISTTDNLLFKREVHDRVEEKASCQMCIRDRLNTRLLSTPDSSTSELLRTL